MVAEVKEKFIIKRNFMIFHIYKYKTYYELSLNISPGLV